MVRPTVVRFCGVYDNVMRRAHESGAEDEDYFNRALMDYQDETGTMFKYRHCWENLKNSPKLKQSEFPKFAAKSGGGSKRYKSSGSSSFNIESEEASINLNTNVGGNDEDEVQEIRRPMGSDKARDAAKKQWSRASGSSSKNNEALARLMVTEMTTQEKEQRDAFIKIKRREVKCRERELATQEYRQRQEDIRFYLQPYDHLTGEQRMAMMIGDYKVEMMNDGMQKFYVLFHGPKQINERVSSNYVDIDGGKDKESPLRIEPFVNQLGKPLNADKEEGPQETYIWRTLNPPAPGRYIYLGGAFPGGVRAWFTLAREAMAQTDILERFENLQDDYTRLAETHDECSDTIRKLVTARQDLEHNAKLYTDMANCYKGLKEKHSEVELARKDSTLVAAEKMSADGAKKRQDLVAQLSKAEIEMFDCIHKLLPTVGRTDEEILNALRGASNFDAYSDKKLYLMYDKLFEKEYPFIMKIATGYRHSVSDLLKVHPDPAPLGGVSAPTISDALAGPPDLSVQKETYLILSVVCNFAMFDGLMQQ
ncbi:putative reverse transcriptase domain-containing protein [Tanacetum coccineum]